MSKSIKFKNNIYLDSTGITHNQKLLSELIIPKAISVRYPSQSNYSLPYSEYTQFRQILGYITSIAFFVHVDAPPLNDVVFIENLPKALNHHHWQFYCWETANDTNKPLVVHIAEDGKLKIRNGVRGMNYFVQVVYINQ